MLTFVERWGHNFRWIFLCFMVDYCKMMRVYFVILKIEDFFQVFLKTFLEM